MKANPEMVREFVNETLQDWGVTVLQVLAEQIKKKKLVLSGELLDSLKFDTLKAAGDQTAKLFLLFQESGRIKDMKALTYKKQPPIKEIEAFVRKVGVAKFKYVPGYTSPGKRPTDDIAIRRIAWGIARHKKKVNTTKPKKWFSKTFYGMLNPLIDNLIEGYQDFAVSNIKEGINGTSQDR